MTLKSNWSIESDDENSRQSFLSDYDSEYDLSPSPRYSDEKYSFSKLNKLSIHQNDPPITRSKGKSFGKTIINPQIVPKEQHYSTIRNSIDSFNYQSPNSPTDGVKTLTDCFESCSLNENKFNKNCFWPNQIISSSPNVTFASNSFSISQTSPLFGQQQTQLWSRFRFSTSTIRNNLWIEQINSTPSNLFTSSILTSSPPQTVPSSSTSIEQFSSPLLKQCQTKEDIIIPKSSSKIFFTLTTFIVGLVLGYLLTHTFPPYFIYHWLCIIFETCIEISIRYFHILNAYFQIVMKYFSSLLLR